MTTLPQEQWSDQQVVALYQGRWQIELLFKRLKQVLHQQRLRSTTAATALPTLIFLFGRVGVAERGVPCGPFGHA